ncbi:hypothetical protein HMI54_004335 [Coelomomyces lativittatus]|nr:hypothetical protein HMI54_004335 [Coelomomyces lativittatus]KAJ1518199.1 hypothetical protein HMI55_001692 [Coelomomyces lativittatus]
MEESHQLRNSSFHLSKFIHPNFLENLQYIFKNTARIRLLHLTTGDEGPVLIAKIFFNWAFFDEFFLTPLHLQPVYFTVYFDSQPFLQCQLSFINIFHSGQEEKDVLQLRIEIFQTESLEKSFEAASNLTWSENDWSTITNFNLSIRNITIGSWTLCDKKCITLTMAQWYSLLKREKKKTGFSKQLAKLFEMYIDKTMTQEVKLPFPLEIPVDTKLRVILGLKRKDWPIYNYFHVHSIQKNRNEANLKMKLNLKYLPSIFLFPSVFKNSDGITRIIFFVNDIKITLFQNIRIKA